MATINRPGKSAASGCEIREAKETVSIEVIFFCGTESTFRKVYPCKDLAEAQLAVDTFRQFTDVSSARILGI